MTDLHALLERVKAATGIDGRENYALNIEIGKSLLGWHLHEHKAFGDYDTDWAEWRDADDKQIRVIPDFSASIDAALALCERVLPGWGYVLHANPGTVPNAMLLSQMFGGERHDAFARTVPLAILAALLTALISKAQEHDQQ